VVIGYWSVFWFYQRRWLFPCHRLTVDPIKQPQKGRSHWLAHPWGKTEVWFLKAQMAAEDERRRLPTVIIAHGQLGVIDAWEERLDGLLKRGFHCLLVEFPGYGRSSGRPSQASFQQTLVAAYDWLIEQPEVDSSAIIGLGRSMGGGVISLLALQRPLACLWLMSTFTSLRPFIRKKGIPSFLLRDPLDNVAAIQQHQLPILVYHGVDDRVIPPAHARQLAAAAKIADLVLVKGDHYNCPQDWDAFWHMAVDFFHRNRVEELRETEK
jgi:hypothetical protein